MISFIVIITQLLAIIFIGAFGRSTSSTLTTYSGYISTFTLMYSPYKKLSLFTLVLLLMVLSISIQGFLLFGTFWDSCFKGFASFFVLDSSILIRGIFCSLCILLTCLDFIGIFRYWQIYFILTPIITIGYSLNSSVLNLGIHIYDGGGGLQIFLFSGIVSLLIWLIVIRGKYQIEDNPLEQSYFNRTLTFIGVVIAVISWPSFNMSGALTSLTNTKLTGYQTLANSALSNTLIAFCVSLTTIMLFSTEGDDSKMKGQIYINSFINSGISISSYSDILQDPSVAMVMSFVTVILTLIFYRYLSSTSTQNSTIQFKKMLNIYSPILFRIIFSLLGIIICSIIVATREWKSPALLDSGYSSRAGLEIAGLFITLAISLFFGVIASIFIKIYLNYRNDDAVQQQSPTALTDLHYFEGLNDQMFPIYSNKDHAVKIQQNKAKNMMKTQLLDKQKNNKKKIDDHETNNSAIVINKQYTKDALNSGQKINVSKMKKEPMLDNYQSKLPQEEEINSVIQIDESPTIVRKSKIKQQDFIADQHPNRKLNYQQPNEVRQQ